MTNRFLVIDYETRSACDITKSGAFEYAAHESTEILCAAFVVGTKAELKTAPVRLWSPIVPGTAQYFSQILRELRNPETQLVAHNALFEQVVTRFCFGRKLMPSRPELQNIHPSRWVCTASLARSHGLPGKLALAGEALGLSEQKDNEGHRLMLKLSKPRRLTEKQLFDTWDGSEDYQRLFNYCEQDVRAEVDLFLSLPDLPAKERKLWVMDQEMNLRGFEVDRGLAQNASRLIGEESVRLTREISHLTAGAVSAPTQRARILKWLEGQGVQIANLQAKTVRDTLREGRLSSDVLRVLEIREELSRSSTAKYDAFLARSAFDGRARDNLIFFGAHTGRSSGTGVQPQNLPRGTLGQADVEAAIPLIAHEDFNLVRDLYPSPMQLLASMLRSVITAPEGKLLYVGDFATIEVRVLFWLCGHEAGLAAFRRGEDLYLQAASQIYGRDLRDLKAAYDAGEAKAKLQRQLGKTVVLGAGFGIGAKKFKMACDAQGIEVSEDLASRAVQGYRKLHWPVPAFWKASEQAAIAAVRNPGRRFRAGKIVYGTDGRFLTAELPIGRKLHYLEPKVEIENSIYGPRPKLSYRSVNPVTRKFEREGQWGGVLVENSVQAVARDCLMEALLALDATGAFTPILTVHDEIVCEGSGGKFQDADLDLFTSTMSRVPTWAEGLPMRVEVWKGKRYRK